MLYSLVSLIFLSCGSDDDTKDTEKPVIDMSKPGSFPLTCDVVYINYLRRKVDKDLENKLTHTNPGVGFTLKKEK